MTALSALDRIVLEEARSIRRFEDDMAGEVGFLDLAAARTMCNRRVARLPSGWPVPYVGTRPGTFHVSGITLRGWSGWRGAYSYVQLHAILNGLAVPGMTQHEQRLTRGIFGQNCMVYRYRFQGVNLRTAGYIGSATGEDSLRQRLGREITIAGPSTAPTAGKKAPGGLEHVISRLQASADRAAFRLDIGSIVPPGVRNRSNVFYLEKLLQSRERPFGNPSGLRTFEDVVLSGRS
jgi:hypothetical protein